MTSTFSKPIVWTVVVCAISLAACCPPNCPPSPALLPQQWDDSIEQQDYDAVVEQTTQVIDKGEDAEFYPEARLYRGVAEARRGGDLKSAQADLDLAEQSIDKLTTVDATREQVLLFRAQMVVRAKLGDIPAAEQYRDRAIELAPELKEDILKEFESATKG